MRKKKSIKREDNYEFEQFRRNYYKVGYVSAVHKAYNVRYVTHMTKEQIGTGFMCGKTMHCPKNGVK